ncbi:ATP-binding protein [Cytobacillus spongiae]|uniref:ATP-binding protein n=1 Tax=Cytobacillus spongiae TaxID=2901381 RepID=UPI001F23E30C|nr:ATP-binding protein [Cytobacillus spongiae]UII57094.1 ATP-binding protein [Cytobacillus spongiae]
MEMFQEQLDKLVELDCFLYSKARKHPADSMNHWKESGVSSSLRHSMDAIQNSFNKNNGSIMIRATLIYISFEMTVQYNGEGLDRDTIKRILPPFFSTRQEGTGIGLAVC